MKILVIGSGGREHALTWRLSLERHEIYSAPGNPGIGEVARLLAASDYLAAAQSVAADLTVVGPEVPLVAGIVDQFRAAGYAIVGPTQENARLEGSKIYAKEFMRRIGIPTARFVRATAHEEARRALSEFDFPVAVKADGLAAGKGVTIAKSRKEAEGAIDLLGPHLVIEEFLRGEEVSFIVLSDGRNVIDLAATQDHKAVHDGDIGPNTGGMGAYCDGRIVSPAERQRILDTIIEPTVRATGFTGFLYAGLMITADGPKVIEFNVRLGDPETQPLMHRIDDGFGDALMRAAMGSLKGTTLAWKPEPSVCVVLAAHGYPGQPRTGDSITGIGNCGAQVFHAGTKLGSRGLETSGGRVLGITASGANLAAAIGNAYSAVAKIHFDGMHYRRDIGRRGLARWPQAEGSG